MSIQSSAAELACLHIEQAAGLGQHRDPHFRDPCRRTDTAHITERPGGQHHITRIAQGQQVRGRWDLRLVTADCIEDLRNPHRRDPPRHCRDSRRLKRRCRCGRDHAGRARTSTGTGTVLRVLGSGYNTVTLIRRYRSVVFRRCHIGVDPAKPDTQRVGKECTPGVSGSPIGSAGERCCSPPSSDR
jgi:hypothetical protein